MNLRELLFWAIAGWTAIGVLGSVVSLARGERARVVRGVAWIAGVWIVYLAALTGVSLAQPQRVVGIGQEQCFDTMCLAVTKVEEVPEFPTHDGSRLVRASVRVRNSGHVGSQSEKRVRAYLLDAQGRRWNQSEGVSGVRLNVPVQAGGTVVSEPVFKVASNATGLALVFTHGWADFRTLVIGDSDSWLHRRTVVKFDR